MAKNLEPIPPGEILLEEFMKPLGISQNRLASDIDVPVTRINQIVNGRRGITADTALRLGEYFKTSPQLWLNLQTAYDLRIAGDEFDASIRTRIRPLPSQEHRY